MADDMIPRPGLRDPRYDILFEPVQIAAHRAKNRFYQPPHCNGMGGHQPQAHAAMRGVKAEGGWAVVNTEHCSVHLTSDVMPEVLHSIVDDGDIPGPCHDPRCGACAWRLGGRPAGLCRLLQREPVLARGAHGLAGEAGGRYIPAGPRAMDKEDIRDLRRWWRWRPGGQDRRLRTSSMSTQISPPSPSSSCRREIAAADEYKRTAEEPRARCAS